MSARDDVKRFMNGEMAEEEEEAFLDSNTDIAALVRASVYFDGELSSEDAAKFERDLAGSTELQEELEALHALNAVVDTPASDLGPTEPARRPQGAQVMSLWSRHRIVTASIAAAAAVAAVVFLIPPDPEPRMRGQGWPRCVELQLSTGSASVEHACEGANVHVGLVVLTDDSIRWLAPKWSSDAVPTMLPAAPPDAPWRFELGPADGKLVLFAVDGEPSIINVVSGLRRWRRTGGALDLGLPTAFVELDSPVQ